jgi:hypothetical protein
MMYSCALWGPEEGGVRGDLDRQQLPGELEAAQHRKIHHVLRKARVKRGDRILEFGSGWGGLAIEAALVYGCEVDTLTLSIEQKRLAEERVEAHGLQGRVRVHLLDYREIPAEWEKAFDAFVSIEMLEVYSSHDLFLFTYSLQALPWLACWFSGALIVLVGWAASLMEYATALQHLFQARRLGPQIGKRGRRGHLDHVSRIAVFWLPVGLPSIQSAQKR